MKGRRGCAYRCCYMALLMSAEERRFVWARCKFDVSSHVVVVAVAAGELLISLLIFH
jgi:hypothetical protein